MANEANHNTLPWVQGNHLELALPMKIVYFTPNGKITQDYEPPTGSTICVEFQSNVNALCFTPTVEGNVLHVTDNGELPVGTYAVNIYVTEPNGDKRCSKLKNSIVVYDDNAETVEEFDDFPDWADGAIISNEIFYFTGTKEVEYITVDTFEQLPQEGVIGNIYRVANYDGTQVNPNAYAEYYWSGSQYKLLDTKNYGIDEKPENGSNNLAKSGGIKSSLDEKANKNGYYETLGAGTATNLRAVDAHDDTFIYRKSGGSQEIATGTSFLEGVKGNTLAWNQRIPSINNFYGTNVVSTISSGVCSFTATAKNGNVSVNVDDLVSNHKYLFCCNYKASSGVSVRFRTFGGYKDIYKTGNANWDVCKDVFTQSSIGRNFAVWDSRSDNWDEISFSQMMLIDLTLIYGSGNEPSTPEEFEADYLRWFGKPLTYEPYDAGSLRDVQMQGLKTTGFNQWDEEWEVGGINSKGANYVATDKIRSKNFCPILPYTNYYAVQSTYTDNTATYFGFISFYDCNYTFILRNSIGTNGKNLPILTPSNARFFKFDTGVEYGSTYNNDICINISDTSKNGTYEPYEEHNVSVPVTTLTGKVNGQGESVVIFPDGMKGVGDIKDEIKVENGVTKAIKRIGRVDLGSLSWTKSTLNRYSCEQYPPNMALATSYNVNSVCGKYKCISASYTGGNPNNYPFCLGIPTSYTNRICIVDSSYSTLSDFLTAMQGVMLDYELAEPVEYVVDDFQLPVNYVVNNNGTEEIIDAQNTIGIAPTVLLRYSIDAAKTITNLPVDYQSQESMANLLNALGAAMGGTWTTTFDTTTNRYTYTFTRN